MLPVAGLEELILEQNITLSPMPSNDHDVAGRNVNDTPLRETCTPMGSNVAKFDQQLRAFNSCTISQFSDLGSNHNSQPSTSQPEAWLLPFTDMFSKRRRFACDSIGRVHIIIGET